MNRDPFSMEDDKAVSGEKRFESRQAEIEDVLVIDGVEFGVLDKIDSIRKFENDAALWLKEFAQAGHKIVWIGRMGKDVIAEDQVSFFTSCS